LAPNKLRTILNELGFTLAAGEFRGGLWIAIRGFPDLDYRQKKKPKVPNGLS
jgi:hypothetical protein